MLVALPDLHRAMQGLHASEQVTKWMVDVSGLPVKLIARLYAMGPVCMAQACGNAAQGTGLDAGSSLSAVDRTAEG
jgi:hypothetical protein